VVTAGAFWERKVSNGHHPGDRTYVQDLKDLFEARPPGGDRLFVFSRVEGLRDYIPFIPLDQLPLYFCHCPTTKGILY
jgi:hypothetical protein